MLNDISEMNRATMTAAMDTEHLYKITDLDLRIKIRRRQIELSNDPAPEQRAQINSGTKNLATYFRTRHTPFSIPLPCLLLLPEPWA